MTKVLDKWTESEEEKGEKCNLPEIGCSRVVREQLTKRYLVSGLGNYTFNKQFFTVQIMREVVLDI